VYHVELRKEVQNFVGSKFLKLYIKIVICRRPMQLP